MMWDETRGNRGGNEMGFAILKWGDAAIHNSAVEELTIWSDNCYGRNNNTALITCLFYVLQKHPQMRINQKFLLRGHTHMETDSAHALVEKKDNY